MLTVTSLSADSTSESPSKAQSSKPVKEAKISPLDAKEADAKAVKIPKGWALTTAEVTGVADLGNGRSAYSLSYPIPETEARGVKNADGEPIKGPIRQNVMSRQAPPLGQKFRLIYEIEEPLMYKVLGPVEG